LLLRHGAVTYALTEQTSLTHHRADSHAAIGHKKSESMVYAKSESIGVQEAGGFMWEDGFAEFGNTSKNA